MFLPILLFYHHHQDLILHYEYLYLQVYLVMEDSCQLLFQSLDRFEFSSKLVSRPSYSGMVEQFQWIVDFLAGGIFILQDSSSERENG